MHPTFCMQPDWDVSDTHQNGNLQACCLLHKLPSPGWRTRRIFASRLRSTSENPGQTLQNKRKGLLLQRERVSERERMKDQPQDETGAHNPDHFYQYLHKMVLYLDCVVCIFSNLTGGWRVYACACVYSQTHDLESLKNADGLNLGICMTVYVYKVHMNLYMLGSSIKIWTDCSFPVNTPFLLIKNPRRCKTSSVGQSAGLLITRSLVRFRQKLKKLRT